MQQRTDKQREAARRNGALSTGPKTTEGRAKSSRNATRHGACATSIFILPHESEEEWQQLHDASVRRFQPADEQEYKVVAQLAGIQWRLQRNTQNETQMLDVAMYSPFVRRQAAELEADPHEQCTLAVSYLTDTGRTLECVRRYEMQLLRAWEKSARLLSLLQSTRDGNRTPPSNPSDGCWRSRLLLPDAPLDPAKEPNEPEPTLAEDSPAASTPTTAANVPNEPEPTVNSVDSAASIKPSSIPPPRTPMHTPSASAKLQNEPEPSTPASPARPTDPAPVIPIMQRGAAPPSAYGKLKLPR